MPSLVLEVGGQVLRSAKIFRPLTTIGASEDNDIRVPNAGLEPTHAQISRERDGLYIAGMTRDMTVNGRREKRRRLEDRDLIRIGELKLMFYLNDEDAPVMPRRSNRARRPRPRA